MSEPGDITLLLQQADQGDRQAADRLFRLVENELRGIARKRQQHILPSITLTGVVDEVFCKLVGQEITQWQSGDRQKFFKYAATKIHNLLINEVKTRQASKRDQRVKHQGLEGVGSYQEKTKTDYHTLIMDLKTALADMPPEAERDQSVFRIRYFLGCTVEETAEILDLTENEVKKATKRARTWLQWHMKSYRPYGLH
ncbi:MAG: sigma-70 family RNA polymerase sigma factor [Gemmataceae bacterium]